MQDIATRIRRRTGRPLSFDRAAALKIAMLTFWRHGYETTSITDLTAAMGITAPSLYTAFGDKKRLFIEAMALYAGDPAAMEAGLAAAPTARDALRAMLVSAAIGFTGAQTPPGCLLASAAATGSAAAADVRVAVAEVRRAIAAFLVARIARDVASGILPTATDGSALADLALAVVQGMSVLARDGVGRDRLLAVVEAAMAAWPPAGPASRDRTRRSTRSEPAEAVGSGPAFAPTD